MPRTIETPAARGADPHTSHAAADAITRSGERHRQQVIVTAMVTLWPGSTSAELADYASTFRLWIAKRVYGRAPTRTEVARCELDRWQIARRLPEAETAEAVQRGAARKCRVNRRRSLTWWPWVSGGAA